MASSGPGARPRSRQKLEPHPNEPTAGATLSLSGAIELRSGALALEFELRGDLSRLSLPASSPEPHRRDRLWEHICFEAFLGARDAGSYLEVNLSPSGDWAVWQFDDHRRGMHPADVVFTPAVRVQYEPNELQLEASVSLPSLREILGEAPYPASLSAIIEETGGRLSFWACHHPAARADFHDRRGWTLLVYAADGT